MRIIAGDLRGRPLASVGKGDPRAHLRPTTDRARETLFNILAGGRFGDPIGGAHVLDLFAGTGALSFEALSRGARFATLVDNGRMAGQLIRQNLKVLDLDTRCQLLSCDVRRLPETKDQPADLVFLDPPYGAGLVNPALGAAQRSGWLTSGALIVIEESSAIAPPDGFDLLDHRKMGGTCLTLLRAPD